MMRMLVVTLIVSGLGATAAVGEEKVDFAKQVLPILQENCGKCHGEKKGAAKLRVHTAAALKEKWDESKGLITAGKPEESDLYKRITLPAEKGQFMLIVYDAGYDGWVLWHPGSKYEPFIPGLEKGELVSHKKSE